MARDVYKDEIYTKTSKVKMIKLTFTKIPHEHVSKSHVITRVITYDHMRFWNMFIWNFCKGMYMYIYIYIYIYIYRIPILQAIIWWSYQLWMMGDFCFVNSWCRTVTVTWRDLRVSTSYACRQPVFNKFSRSRDFLLGSCMAKRLLFFVFLNIKKKSGI